jgi:hypothetical protein
MLGVESLIDAQQKKLINNYRNTKNKLLKSNVAICNIKKSIQFVSKESNGLPEDGVTNIETCKR